MGLIHTPRTIASICKGLLNRRRQLPTAATVVGVGEGNHHVYKARLGLFDVDYLGHMNNAAYLSHAELARWELTAFNGMLYAMYKNNVNFLVVGTTIRYRKEIRPIFNQFQIDTTVCGLDERNMWISHNFRLPAKDESQKPSLVMAQMIVQGVAVKGRDVINPGTFLREKVGFDGALTDSIAIQGNVADSTILDGILQQCASLEDSMKAAAAFDDEKFK